MNKKVLHDISYGVYVVTTLDGERHVGCIANSVMQVTSSPATIAVSINRDNYTNGCIVKTGKFAISILSEKSSPKLIGTFGFKSGRDTDKFAGISYEFKDSLPVIMDSCGYILLRLINKMETATHTVFLGEVYDCEAFAGAGSAMTYAYYHKVIKGKSPKNAPTYQSDEEVPAAGSKKYKCRICGYIHKGKDINKNFICPVCGQGSEHFIREE
ncbi:MAG: flavin reductase [Clostridiales bacterium]|nr:flavin reductase [Clostridiales bacterium]